MTDEYYLRVAINLARQSAEIGGDPFGALLVFQDKIVAKSVDKSVEESDPTCHAELSVIRDYCRNSKILSLEGYTLYSSSEPCIMCSGAIHWARISRVIFSVPQELLQRFSGGRRKPGCKDLINSGSQKVEIIGPLLAEEGIKIFQDYPLNPKMERHSKLWSVTK